MFERYDSFKVSATGWVKAYGLLNKSYLRYSNLVFNPDPTSVLLLNEYVDICKLNNIKLVFVQVPEHYFSLVYEKKYKDFNSFIINPLLFKLSPKINNNVFCDVSKTEDKKD